MRSVYTGGHYIERSWHSEPELHMSGGSREAHHNSITPCSPISLSPSSALCVHVCTCVSMSVCACMCGKVVRKEGMGRHREETPANYSTQPASEPDLPNTTTIFCIPGVFIASEVILHIFGNCIDSYLVQHYSTVGAQNT